MPPSSDNESSLDRINQRLYDNRPLDLTRPEALGAPQAREVPHAWENEPMPQRPKKRASFAVMFFTGAVLFFIIAVGLATWLLLSGDRSVSTDNVVITVQGPTSIAAGDTVPLAITIENKNPSSLDEPDLTVTFPDGTRSADDVTQPDPRYEETPASIAAGGTLNTTAKAVLFGDQGQVITIPIQLTYHTAGSNAVFVKNTTYTLTVTTAPLAVTVDTLAQTVSGQPFTIDVQVRSNATAAIPDAVLEADYPFGFTVTSASPAASSGGDFDLGTLQPGQSQDIKITGTLSGQTTQASVFRFTAGTADSTGALSLAYTSKDADVSIAAPFLATTLTLNGSDASDVTIAAGQTVQGTLSWTNTLTEPVTNAVVTLQLTGSALDPSSVHANEGFYQSSDNTITFDSTTDSALASLAPGQSGSGSFSFSTLPGTVQNPTLSAVVSIQGQRLDESNVASTVNASVTDTIKIASDLAISANAFHSSGPFANTGPVPPTTNQATTYDIQLNVTNSTNEVAGATAVATLPSYVTFTNQVVPSGAVTYDDSSRQVTWNIGDLAAGASQQASFQVSITPSDTQQGTAPTLVGPVTLTGYDRYAQTQVTSTSNPVTTDTTNDAGYRAGEGDVQ